MDLKEKIKTEAHRLGFSLIGFTDLQPPQSIGLFQSWVKNGLHASMEYLARPSAIEKRGNPIFILPAAKTIISLGMRYPRPQDIPEPKNDSPHGKIAAYAWGEDYHHIIPARINQLVIFIEGFLGTKVTHKAYTDTGPILERDLAQRSGLGWIGKNSCLIEPSSGSYYLLAELFLDIEIEPDPPFALDYCGSCRRCIEACPTGCILPDRTIDSQRCISFLTIENKGAIDPSLRTSLGDWVFGCDICQQVCPWNIRFGNPDHDPAFISDPNIARPALIIELSLTPQDFNRKFKNSPVQRARRRGYLRNVAVALGNSHDPAAVPALAACLESEPEALVRTHAAWALGEIRTATAKEALLSARNQEQGDSVRKEIEQALERFYFTASIGVKHHRWRASAAHHLQIPTT